MFSKVFILAALSAAAATCATLYGVTGDGATVKETLYILNQTNASSTLVGPFGNGADGEVIAFNPSDGRLYHWSGVGTGDAVMESTPVAAVSVTNIPRTGTQNQTEIFGAIWDAANNRFLLTDINTHLISATTAGVFTDLGIITGAANDVRGPVFVGGTLYAAEAAPSPLLYSINPAVPAVLTNTPITLAGFTLAGINGMAVDPDTGLVWAIARLSTGGRRLATINLSTGVLTSVGTLGDNFSSLAFGPATTTTPEPGSVLLTLTGLAGLACAKRRNRAS